MAPIPTKARISAAIAAVALSVGIVACSHDDGYTYDNCPDWQCGPGLYYAPYIIPAIGVYGQPGYHTAVTIQPNQPGYKTTYVGKPPNFTPPSGAKINPKGQQAPKDYKAPTGSTLTVQKAPQKSNNTVPSGSSGGSSGGSGSKQTVQKAPSGSSGGSKSSGGSSGGSKSGGSSSGGSKK